MEVPKEVASLMGQEQFDLDTFFTAYYGAQALLKTAEDFGELLARYLNKARSQGVLYTEVSIDF